MLCTFKCLLEYKFYLILFLLIQNINLIAGIDAGNGEEKEFKSEAQIAERSQSLNDSLVNLKLMDELHLAQANGDNYQVLKCYNRQIYRYFILAKFEEAKKFILLAEETIVEVNDDLEKAWFFQLCGRVDKELSNYNLSIYYFNKSIELYNQIAIKDSLHDIYTGLALNYHIKHEFDAAAKNAKRSLAYAELDKDSVKIARSKRILGQTNAEQQNYPIALDFFFQNLDYFQRHRDSVELGHSLNSIGLTYYFMGDYEMSLLYSKKSLEIRESLNHKVGLMETYNNLALVYGTQENWDLALIYLRKSLVLNEELRELENTPTILINIGDAKLSQKMYEEAKVYYEKAYSYEKSNNELYANQRYHFNAFKINIRMKQFEEALRNYMQFINYKDSIDYNKQREYLAELNIQYQTEQKEKQLQLNSQKIKLLEADKIIKQSKIEHQRKWLIALISGVTVFVIFIGVVSHLIFVKNRAYRFLVAKNVEIANKESIQHTDSVSFIQNVNLGTSELDEDEAEEPQKYIDSKLTDEHKKELLTAILEKMKEEKPYLDKDFSLEGFAKQLGSIRSYVSQTINEELKLNFRNFVNQYRVSEARQMLTKPENKHLTIESIAYEVGFGSKSSFNAAFKAHTGITPSFFMKSIKENNRKL